MAQNDSTNEQDEEGGDGAAPGLVLKYREQFSTEGVDQMSLLKTAMRLEDTLAQIAALASVVNDGTLYGLEKGGIKTERDYATLLFILASMEKAGKFLEKNAKRAKNGTEDKNGADGHASRFAEMFIEQGKKNVRFADIGLFYLTSPLVASGPTRAMPTYDQFDEWLSANGCKVTQMQWQKFQTAAKAANDAGTLPSFIKVKHKTEVRIRKG